MGPYVVMDGLASKPLLVLGDTGDTLIAIDRPTCCLRNPTREKKKADQREQQHFGRKLMHTEGYLAGLYQ